MTLVQEIQAMAERLYKIEMGVDLQNFIFSDDASQDFLSLLDDSQRQLADFACLFLLPDDNGLNLAIYFSERLLKILNSQDPRTNLNDNNVTESMALIEELTHAIHATLNFIERNSDLTSEIELANLELQAKLDTYELLGQLITSSTGSTKLNGYDRLWLRYQVFERERFNNKDREINYRYRLANELGHRYAIFLDKLPKDERGNELRWLRTLNFLAKKRYIETVSN